MTKMPCPSAPGRLGENGGVRSGVNGVELQAGAETEEREAPASNTRKPPMDPL